MNNIIRIGDMQTKIYRIFSFERFLDLICTKTNGLVNPNKWDDPFENFFLKCHAKTDEGELVSLESIAASWYGQCWTLNEETDAMWRIYSPKKTGVRVTTTCDLLFSNFYDSNDKHSNQKYLIGAVAYETRESIENFLLQNSFHDLSSGGQPYKFAYTMLIKRPEFTHEKEIRILFQDSSSNRGKDGVAVFPFNFSKIITEVALDPRLCQEDVESAKQKIIESGYTFPVVQSKLYSFPAITIRLT